MKICEPALIIAIPFLILFIINIFINPILSFFDTFDNILYNIKQKLTIRFYKYNNLSHEDEYNQIIKWIESRKLHGFKYFKIHIDNIETIDKLHKNGFLVKKLKIYEKQTACQGEIKLTHKITW